MNEEARGSHGFLFSAGEWSELDFPGRLARRPGETFASDINDSVRSWEHTRAITP